MVFYRIGRYSKLNITGENNGGHHQMPSIQIFSLDPNSLAVLTTAVGLFFEDRPLPNSNELISSSGCPAKGRAVKIDLPNSEQYMKLHWSPPEAYSIGIL
jgi:hypothetical protein